MNSRRWITNALTRTFTVNNLNELTGGGQSGTLTVAGNTTELSDAPPFYRHYPGVTNVTVGGTGLPSGPASLYFDGTWASSNAVPVTGLNTYTAVAQDDYGRAATNTVSVTLPAPGGYTYDLNGNLLADGARNFAYDDENRLTSVWATNAWRCDFAYDGLSRRRVETDYAWQGGAWVPTAETRFIYDGNLVIQERDANNLPQVTYTRGSDLSGGLTGAGGIGGLLARTENPKLITQDSQATADYFSDRNGNIVGLVYTNGTLAAKYSYDPYGNLLAQSGPLASANAYRFSSQAWNAQSGLYCYLYRFYSPDLQRWVNRDPLGERGGVNLFGFVGNNPLGRIDPLGLFDCAAAAAAIARQESNIHGAIHSMSDINQTYDSAENMQILALGGEFAYAFMGGGSAASELSEYNAVRFSRPAYNLGGVTSGIVFNESVYAGLVDFPNSVNAEITGLNILNPAESVAQSEIEFAKNMSALTYQTIQSLQTQLANMMDAYRKECPCKK